MSGTEEEKEIGKVLESIRKMINTCAPVVARNGSNSKLSENSGNSDRTLDPGNQSVLELKEVAIDSSISDSSLNFLERFLDEWLKSKLPDVVRGILLSEIEKLTADR